MERVFPDGRARSLASDLVLPDLGSVTPEAALAAGAAPMRVWKAIISLLGLPESYEYLHRVNPDERHAKR